MSCLKAFTPEVEVYSIDEAFLYFSVTNDNLFNKAKKIREFIFQCTGIPVSIGLAKTKTLAKIANHIAKKHKKCGVYIINNNHNEPDTTLKEIKVEDIWGISKKWKVRLKKESKSFDQLRKIMAVNNPRIIPRNHIVEKALKKAEEGDLKIIKEYLEILKNPYSSKITISSEYLRPPNDSEKVLQTFCGT